MESAGRHHSLHTVIDVLESLETGERGVSEIAQDLGLAKGGVHKILKNLEERGYVRCHGHRYRLGLRLWTLGTRAVTSLGLREAAAAPMSELTRVTREGSLLSVYDDGDVIYIEKVGGPSPVTTTTQIGGRAPAFCTATGKAILAWLPRAQVDEAISRPLEKFNDSTVTDPATLLAELEEVRFRGYAVNHGAWRGEIHGLAAPVSNFNGEVVAALAITGPAFRFGDGGIERFAPQVIDAARELSRELGGEGR